MRQLANLVIVLLILVGTANAETKFKPGTSFTVTAQVTVIADATGKLKIVPTSDVTILSIDGVSTGPVVTPTPDPTPNPNPATLSLRAIQFKVTADTINDPVTAKQLGALYIGMDTYIKANPTTTRQQMETAVAGATSIFLRNPATATKWKPVTDKFQAEWVKAVQDGASLQEYGTLFIDAGSGLNASAPGQAAMFMDEDHPEAGEQSITPDKIMQIIQIIISSGGKLNLQTIFQIIMILLSP
jgi:hypothetical protein